MFNKKNYYVSLTENTPIGTPLPIDINVHDPDMVSIVYWLIFILDTFVQSTSIEKLK